MSAQQTSRVAALMLASLGLHIALNSPAVTGFLGTSLFIDEAQYADWSRQLQWGYFSKPPAVAALIAASTALFGEHLLGVRALAMAAWVTTAGVLAWLASRVSHSPVAPTWTAAVWLASPLAFLLGLVATTDALLVLCWALALVALWQASGTQRPTAVWGWAAVFAAALAVGLLDKYTMAGLLPGALAWAWRRGRLRPFLVGALAALLAFAPHLAWNQAMAWPTLRHTAEITVQSGQGGGGLFALGQVLGQGLAQAFLVAPLLTALLAWRLLVAVRARRSRSAAQAGPLRAEALSGQALPVPTPTPQAAPGFAAFLLWTHAPLALAGALQAGLGPLELNWLAPLHLAAALALGVWHGRWLKPAVLAAGLLMLQVLLWLALVVLPPAWAQRAPAAAWLDRVDLLGRTRGWEDALTRLQASLPVQTPLLLVGSSRAVLAHAGWHWRGLDLARAAWRPDLTPGHHYELICPWRGRPPGWTEVWLLSEGPPDAAMAASFGGLHTVARAPLRRLVSERGELVLSRAQNPAWAPNDEGLCR